MDEMVLLSHKTLISLDIQKIKNTKEGEWGRQNGGGHNLTAVCIHFSFVSADLFTKRKRKNSNLKYLSPYPPSKN